MDVRQGSRLEVSASRISDEANECRYRSQVPLLAHIRVDAKSWRGSTLKRAGREGRVSRSGAESSILSMSTGGSSPTGQVVTLPPLQRTSAGTSHASRFRSTRSGTGSACMLQAHESSWLRHVPFYVRLPTSLPVSGLSALLRTSARAPYPKEDEKYDAGCAINPVPVPKACGDFSKQPRTVGSWRVPGSTYPLRFCLSPSLASDITCSSLRQ